MSTTIQWQSDFQQARQQAKAAHKPVLLDFYNPQ